MARGTNDFSPETRRLFEAHDGEYAVCWGCGANHADCGHHIEGRGVAGESLRDRCESSPLNFAPLGNESCHIPLHGHWSSPEGKAELLGKTWRHLIRISYKLTPLDEAFLEKYGEEITRLNIKL